MAEYDHITTRLHMDARQSAERLEAAVRTLESDLPKVLEGLRPFADDAVAQDFFRSYVASLTRLAHESEPLGKLVMEAAGWPFEINSPR